MTKSITNDELPITDSITKSESVIRNSQFVIRNSPAIRILAISIIGLILLRLSFWGELSLPWPGLAIGLVICAIWLWPGLLLWHMVNWPTPSPAWFYWLPMSFAFGLAWLMGGAIIVLIQHGNLDTFVTLTLRANALLLLIEMVRWRMSEELGIKNEEESHNSQFIIPNSLNSQFIIRNSSAPIRTLVGLMVIVLLAVFVHSYGFTLEGDEWSLLPTIRNYLDGWPIFTKNISFDLWNFILALVVRLSGESLIEVYRFYLPLLFMLVALSSFMVLADTLLVQRELVYLAVLLQGLYFLSDIHTDSNGVGLAFFARLQEDKFATWLLIFPLAQAYFLKFLQQKRYTHSGTSPHSRINPDGITFGLMAMLAVAIHPIAFTWLAFSTVSILAIQSVYSGNLRSNLSILVILFLGLGLISWLWWRAPLTTEFMLTAPENDYLLKLNARRLWLLPHIGGGYMLHLFLLSHPLVILALMANLTLLPKLKTDLTAQFLFSNTMVVLFLLYNPFTAPLIGRLVTPWMLYRIGWMLPVTLTLAYTWQMGIKNEELGIKNEEESLNSQFVIPNSLNSQFIIRNSTSQLRHLALVVGLAIILQSHMAASWRSLHVWNAVTITQTEQQVMTALRQNQWTTQSHNLTVQNKIALAPHAFSIHLSALVSQITPFTKRNYGLPDPLIDTSILFFNTPLFNERTHEILQYYSLQYIVTKQTDAIEVPMRLLPHLFKLIAANSDYSFYIFQPSQMTSLDTMLFKANSVFLRDNNLIDAQSIYETILQQNPTYLPAILGLGAIYESQFNFDQAADLYQTAVEALPDNPWLKIKLADSRYLTTESSREGTKTQRFLSGNAIDNIINLYRQAIELEPENQGLYNQVLTAYQRFSPEIKQSLAGQALKYTLLDFYEARAKVELYDFERQQKLAQVYGQVSENKLAIKQYQAMATRFPGNIEPYFQLAEIFQQQNQPDLVLQAYQDAIAHEPQPPSGYPYIKLAQFYCQQKNYQPALKYAQKATTFTLWGASDQTVALAHQEQGHIYWAQQKRVEATQQFSIAMKMSPSAELAESLGRLSMEQKHYPEAITYFQQAIQLAPQRAWFHISLANALVASGQVEAGLQELPKAIMLEPTSANINLKVGELLWQHKSATEALPYLKNAVRLEPENSYANLLLAKLYRQQQQLDRAMDYARQATRLAKNDRDRSEGHFEQGNIYNIQKMVQAGEHFIKAAELQPNNAWIQATVGHWYWEQGNLSEAITYFRRALSLDGGDLAWDHLHLGTLLLETGQSTEGIAELKKAIALEPNSLEIYQYIGNLAMQYQRADFIQPYLKKIAELNKLGIKN